MRRASMPTELCNLCKQDEWWLQEINWYHPVTHYILLLFLLTHHLKLGCWNTVYITLAFGSTNIPIVLVIDDKMRSTGFSESKSGLFVCLFVCLFVSISFHGENNALVICGKLSLLRNLKTCLWMWMYKQINFELRFLL